MEQNSALDLLGPVDRATLAVAIKRREPLRKVDRGMLRSSYDKADEVAHATFNLKSTLQRLRFDLQLSTKDLADMAHVPEEFVVALESRTESPADHLAAVVEALRSYAMSARAVLMD